MGPPFFEAPRFALRGGLGYVSPAPPEQPRRTSLLSTRTVVLGATSFGVPPFLPKRSVCNWKGLLRAPRFCVRARLDTLRFRSGELGSDFVVPWSFSDLFRVIPCQDPPRDRLWTEPGRILGYLGRWPPSPARSPLRRPQVLSNGRPPQLSPWDLRNNLAGSSPVIFWLGRMVCLLWPPPALA